jgi:hypothetical protein
VSAKIVSALCHRTSRGDQRPLSDGDYPVTDKDVTGVSWPEEEIAQRGEAVPFRL